MNGPIFSFIHDRQFFAILINAVGYFNWYPWTNPDFSQEMDRATENVLVHIAKCNCPNSSMFLPIEQNIFVQIGTCICPNCKIKSWLGWLRGNTNPREWTGQLKKAAASTATFKRSHTPWNTRDYVIRLFYNMRFYIIGVNTKHITKIHNWFCCI